MARVAIIANPQAGRNRRGADPAAAARALQLAAPGAPFHVAGRLEDLAGIVQQVRGQGADLVAIAGGDGTVQQVLTALALGSGGRLPAVALLGGGAYDSLAPLGGRGSPAARLRRLVEALASGAPLLGEEAVVTGGRGRRSATSGPARFQIEERDLLLVGGAGEAAHPAGGICGFRFGLGMPLRFVEEIYATGSVGRWPGLVTFARALGSTAVLGPLARSLFAPLPLRSVVVDQEEWPALPLRGLFCASVAEAGLGLRPFRRAVEQPGFFQVMGLLAGPRTFARELLRLSRGRPPRRDRIFGGVGERVVLHGSAGSAFLLDGEVRRAERDLTISVGPRVRLVRA